jgi:hypothetical protein
LEARYASSSILPCIICFLSFVSDNLYVRISATESCWPLLESQILIDVEIPVGAAAAPARPPPLRAVMSTYMSPLELMGRGRPSPHPHAELKDMDEQSSSRAATGTPQLGTADTNGAVAAQPRPASPAEDVVPPSAAAAAAAEDPVLAKLLADEARIPWWKIGLITLVLCLFALVGVFRGSNSGQKSSRLQT